MKKIIITESQIRTIINEYVDEFPQIKYETLKQIWERKLNDYMKTPIVDDINKQIIKYQIAVLKAQLVANPKFNVSTTTHPRTNVTYIAIKIYWPDENGKLHRTYTRNVGRLDEFPEGYKNAEFTNKAKHLAQETLYHIFMNEVK